MRRKRSVVVALAALAAGLALTGCESTGGSQVASANGGARPTSSASPPPAADPEERALQFQQCMKEHGAEITASGAPIGTSVSKDFFAKAQEACRIYAPSAHELHKYSPEEVEKLRQLSRCVREHGVPEWPDPDPETGEIMFMPDPKKYPKAPEALEACKRFDIPKEGQGE
jgi:hypothetical protein